jgi:hypothetical protein
VGDLDYARQSIAVYKTASGTIRSPSDETCRSSQVTRVRSATQLQSESTMPVFYHPHKRRSARVARILFFFHDLTLLEPRWKVSTRPILISPISRQ